MQEELKSNKTFLSVNKITGAIDLISETLFLMANKRVTLEEKAIRSSLHELVTIMAGSLSILHKRFEYGNYDIDEVLVGELDSLLDEISAVVRELKKAVEYNLNYLEQYFEYDYLARLTNEHKFNQRLKNLNNKFESQ